MSLAKDLLAKGESRAVLQYFEDCRKFWKRDNGRLALWAEDVKVGNVPEFGPNLIH